MSYLSYEQEQIIDNEYQLTDFLFLDALNDLQQQQIEDRKRLNINNSKKKKK